MFRRKAEKRIAELSPDEARLLRGALLAFRNKLLSAGKPTEDTQTKDDGGQKGHQRKGRADRRQRIAPQKLPDDQRIGDVIALLQEITQNHGDGEQQHGLDNRSLC